MVDEIYLDNSSTTKVCSSAINKVVELMQLNYGNPASLHSKGISAEREVSSARQIIAKSLGCKEEEIYFTSGGTESNNLAILGTVLAKRKLGNKIITSSIEHPSVLKCMEKLEDKGFDVVYLKPNSNGIIDEADILNAVDKNTILISIMMVNNEIGSVQPIEIIKKAVKLNNSPALIHTDSVQAFGKLPIKTNKLGIDLLSLSSHKIHGPKGIGVIYIKKGSKIKPINLGGGQENGIRSGTLATELIAGLGVAVSCLPNLNSEYQRILELNNLARNKLAKIPPIKFNNSCTSIPYILNFSVGNIRSETLLHFLASKGIFVSSGSACAKGKPSYVLSEIGIDNNSIDSSIRISFSRYNTEEDIYILVEAIQEALATLITK